MQSSKKLLSALLIATIGAIAAPATPAPGDPPAGAPQVAKKEEPDAGTDETAKKKRPERDSNTCLTCHRTLSDTKLRVVAEEYEHSVHRDERIGCVACHKGNPTDPTVQSHDKTTGFVVRPTHQQISAICGGCHEDPTFVRRFNASLGVDQRKLYDLSRHGKIAGAGDQNSPTCTSCHGTHAILSVASPNALVNRRQVKDLCAKCHADKEYMKPYGLPSTQTEKWSKSVHGKAFAQGHEKSPTCTGCHSPHAGTLPGTATVAALCDRCHQDERDLFMKSPHSRAFRKLGLADCVPCHGDHDVGRSTWLAGMTPDSACSKCHAKDEKPRQVAEEVARILNDIEAEENGVRVDVADARRAGLLVPDASYALDRLRTSKVRLIATVHTLDVRQLNEDAKQAKTVAAEARDILSRARRARQLERRGYFAAIGMASLLFVLLVLKSIELARRRRRSEP